MGMKRLFIIFALLSVSIPGYAYVDQHTAVLRVLNKAAGKTQTILVPVNYSVDFEKLNIAVRACKQTDPFQAENHFAFVEISQVSQGQIFGGWMNKNEPGNNPLQNPDYDVWLVNCEQ
jgi:hypothetical protein